MKAKLICTHLLLVSVVLVAGIIIGLYGQGASADTSYKTVKVNDLKVFYREAGNKNAPTVLLLHGFPTSSHMYRNLMAELSDSYYLLAPPPPW